MDQLINVRALNSICERHAKGILEEVIRCSTGSSARNFNLLKPRADAQDSGERRPDGILSIMFINHCYYHYYHYYY